MLRFKNAIHRPQVFKSILQTNQISTNFAPRYQHAQSLYQNQHQPLISFGSSRSFAGQSFLDADLIKGKSAYEIIEMEAQYIDDKIVEKREAVHEKTAKGRSLSEIVASRVNKDHFDRKQRYDQFIKKMDELLEHEAKHKELQDWEIVRMQNSVLQSPTPIRDTLTGYNRLSRKKYNPDSILRSVEQLKNTIRAKGFQDIYADYSRSQMENSWRMNKVADDIMFACREDQYFSPWHMQQTTRALGEIGYKNCKMIEAQVQKVEFMLKERETNSLRKPSDLSWEEQVFGGMENMFPKHYVYNGFQDNEEFMTHVRTILDWETTIHDEKYVKDEEVHQSANLRELEEAMAKVIESSLELKNLNRDIQASIDAVRTQYKKLVEAQNKHEFLENNKYIVYDMLEIQELLVKGGFLTPEEAYFVDTMDDEFQGRMDRASNIFYNYVKDYQPNLLSPQHETFFKASQDSVDKYTERAELEEEIPVVEEQNLINAGNIGQIMMGIHQQALSPRRDANDDDFVQDFYRKNYLDEDDWRHAQDIHSGLQKAKIIQLNPQYTKGFHLFQNGVKRMASRVVNLVEMDKDKFIPQIRSFLSLSAFRLDQPNLRFEVAKRVLNMWDRNQHKIDGDHITIHDSLLGMAMSNKICDNQREIARRLVKKADVNAYNYDQKVSLLWSMCALDQVDNQQARDLLEYINFVNYERVSEEVQYNSFQRLTDIYNYLEYFKINEPERNLPFIEKESLRQACINPELTLSMYQERAGEHNPFRPKILNALTTGLGQASIDHDKIFTDQFYHQARGEGKNQDAKFNSKPDIVMGFQGHKVALWLCEPSESYWDIGTPDGAKKFQMRIIEKYMKNKLKTAGISQAFVVDIDVGGNQISYNNDFDFNVLMEHQVGKLADDAKTVRLSFQNLNTFTRALVDELDEYYQVQQHPKEVQKMERFIHKITELIKLKQRAELQPDEAQVMQAYDELRYEIMKLSIYYEAMHKDDKKFVDQFLAKVNAQGEGNDFQTFKQLLVQEAKQLPQTHYPVEESVEPDLDFSWRGTRLEVELPMTQETAGMKKNIECEIIDQKVMYVEDYCHYKDWEAMLKETFDGFSYLQIQIPKDRSRIYYNYDTHRRMIPQGIFPLSTHKRDLLEPSNPKYKTGLEARKGKHDQFAEYQRDPLKLMIVTEMEKQKDKKPMTDDLSMIVNLLNMKHAVKADLSDKQIMQKLNSFDFTDQLIEEHLAVLNGGQKANTKNAKFVPRDAAQYRQFILDSYSSKKQSDSYSQFFLKESGKHERVHAKIREKEEISKKMNEERITSKEYYPVIREKLESIDKEIEDMLLENDMEDNDRLDFGAFNRTHVHVNYDLKSLFKSDFLHEMDPDVEDRTLTDQEFVYKQRRQGETKIIKTKIIYKIDQNIPLSANEKEYLNTWISKIDTSSDVNILNLRDLMVPQDATQMSLSHLSGEDFFALNSFAKVHLDRDQHGAYALSDIILELQQFIDDDFVNKVQMQALNDRIKSEFNLHPEFQVVDARNKEIDIMLKRTEELAWRMAGCINDKDFDIIKQMVSIDRNEDHFDRQFYDNDMESMRQFIDDANKYDNRLDLFYTWILRKEMEIKARRQMPPPQMKKTDQELYKTIDVPFRRARESLVAQLLTKDEFGKEYDQPKKYLDLTQADLHKISENLAIRLYLFNYDYPSFVPQIIRATMDHPNLSKADKQTLDTYCKIFEVDWRFDSHIHNKDKIMATNPIYMEGSNFNAEANLMTPENIKLEIRKACIPFLEDLTNKVKKQARRSASAQ